MPDRAGIADPLATFPRLRVLVIGEAMLDSYLEGPARSLSREAPIPVVDVAQRRDVPGGAANTAVNVRSLGAQVTFLAVLGDDAEAERLREALAEREVPTDALVVEVGRQTLAKQRVVADGQPLVRFDQGSTGPIAPTTEQVLVDRLRRLVPAHDAVIVSDYAYGVLTARVIQALADLQAASPRVLVVDTRDPRPYQEVAVTAVKPNYAEVLHLLGEAPVTGTEARLRQVLALGHRVLDAVPARIAAVTLDRDGALIFERGRQPYRTYAERHLHTQTAGAGDTFVSAFTLALAAGADTTAAADLAAAATSIVVQKPGTAACTTDELRAHLLGGEKSLPTRSLLAARLERHRRQGQAIVFTNGCFDLLHPGHVAFLNQARGLGDVLVVGLNSDASVRRLKGADRPINTLDDRARVLEALSCVDYLVSFDENTPHELIRLVRPDVFVKGGTYTRESLPEASLVEALGGRVEVLPYLTPGSTSGLIQRIRAAEPRPLPDRAALSAANG